MIKKILNFKTNILLKNLVGKDLINDDNIAIIELVKNSYDANSKSVLIKFTNFIDKQTSNNSQIIISDEGVGMDEVDIEEKWLNIAYSDKKQIKPKEGSFIAGNKGIGRFSCDRLGEKLDLLTRKNGKEILHLNINWQDFEIEGDRDLTIQEIDLEVKSIDVDKAVEITKLDYFPKNGTVLVISNLRSQWYYEKLRELKTSLEKFLNPNQLFSREKFSITLLVPDLIDVDKKRDYNERINGEVQNQIFQKLNFNATYIEANVLKENDLINIVLYHDGEKVFDLKEKNDRYPLLKGTKIVIYFLNPYKKAYFKRQTGVRSVDFGSIFLFLNGFRIPPYGDRGDDWLGLDVRKTQGTQRYLGSRDIVGRIEIQGSEDNFKPISSREGLKNTRAFVQLKDKLFFEIFRKLEIFVVDGLRWDSIPPNIRSEVSQIEGLDWKNTKEHYVESWDRKKQRISLSILTLIGVSPEKTIKFWFNPSLLESLSKEREEDLEKLLIDIGKYDSTKIDESVTIKISDIRDIVKKKDQEAKDANLEASNLRVEVANKDAEINKIMKEKETYRAQTLFLQQVTTLDMSQLLSFHHQIKLDSNIIENYLGKSIKEIKKTQELKNVLDYLQKASLTNKRISVLAQYATKANFRSAIKAEITDVPAYIEQYILNVAKEYNAANLEVKINNRVEELFEMKVSRIEVSILLENIIHNAIKARAKNLLIEILKIEENKLRIIFLDDGVGLSKDISNLDSIFEMGITTTSGSGLGLYHSKLIVEKMGGKIYALLPDNNGFELVLELMN